jgi:predicted anti-sigma-YlaC factor YlaD
MTCAKWREAISAVADGEEPGVDQRLLDGHLARCPSCREFRDQVERHRRVVRIGEADPIPDLSRRIVKLNAVADRMSRWRYARAALAVVAVEIIVMSVPALVLGDESATSAHAARHLGAFSIAYAVGLLVVVARPARARTMLPVALVLAGALLLTSIIDIANGSIPLVTETGHIPELLSVLLVWLLALPAPRRDARAAVPSPGRVRLVRAPGASDDERGEAV